ncbi:MAG: hypothetical protein QOJ56_5532, partial [Mycobacterium sp.]|nr:hypothetical protein [Mycobacterium sp.]
VFPPAQRETGRDGMMRVLLVGMTNDALSGRRVGLGTAANFDLTASAGVRFRAVPVAAPEHPSVRGVSRWVGRAAAGGWRLAGLCLRLH